MNDAVFSELDHHHLCKFMPQGTHSLTIGKLLPHVTVGLPSDGGLDRSEVRSAEGAHANDLLGG